jgi:hypothetical protein
MFAGILGVGEMAGRFQHDLRAHRIPIELSRVFSGKYLDFFSSDRNRVGVGGHLFFQPPQDGVVLEQVRQRLGIRKIVYGDKFHVVPMQTRANDIPANPAKTIDSYLYCHTFSCLKSKE